MGKLPAFLFFPKDWLTDNPLCVCTKGAKGVWADMLCLMFVAPSRGVLAFADGKPWSDQEVAEAIGGNTATNLELLMELLTKGVVHRDKKGAIFSRRMVRDEEDRKCATIRKRRERKVDRLGVSHTIVTPDVTPMSVTATGTVIEEDIYRPSNSEELIERVVRLHPANQHLKNSLQLPPAHLEIVMRAIIRDGPELVEQGTKFCAEIAAKYPQSRRNMIPGPAKFWGLEAHYLKGKDYWDEYLAGGNGVHEPDQERCEHCGGPKWLPSKLTPNKVRECDCKPVV